MYTIGQLGREFGLSRSTLLYYDAIGLLRPSGRDQANNYRRYAEKDRSRLEQICVFRKTGLPLKEIGRLLDKPGSGSAAILEQRLDELNSEIGRLREQQHVILRLLGTDRLRGRKKVLDKKAWVGLLRSIGLDDKAMDNWHVEFERLSPDAHRDFLRSLGIPAAEIRSIRSRSRLGAKQRGETDEHH